MLIISQNKKEITDEIKFTIEEIGYHQCYAVIEIKTRRKFGTYQKEERAKEILEEIANNAKKELYKMPDK